VQQLDVAAFVQDILNYTCSGTWTQWSDFGFQCSSVCGDGEIRRRRECRHGGVVNGSIMHDCGNDGREDEYQFVQCNLGACQGILTDWYLLQCSATCNIDGNVSISRLNTIRLRHCIGSTDGCNGSHTEEFVPCPYDIRNIGCPGNWESWSDYGICQSTCFISNNSFPQQTRNRSCIGDTLKAGCTGINLESRNCQNVTCLARPTYTGLIPSPYDIQEQSFKVQLVKFDESFGAISEYIICVIPLSARDQTKDEPWLYSNADILTNKDDIYVAVRKLGAPVENEYVTIGYTSSKRKRRAVSFTRI